MKDRTKTVKKNIIYSVLLRFVGISLTFILLPLTVHYLTAVEYGVWVTLFTVMNWVNFLDVGLGLGLRNKLAEAVSKNNLEAIKTYLSTGLFAMLIMGTMLLAVFFIGINFFNMQEIYNTKSISEIELYKCTLFAGIFVIISFVLSVINQIYYAYQKAAYTGLIQVIYNSIMLGIVYYLTLQPNHSLFNFILSFGISMLISRIIFICIFFIKNMEILPKKNYIKLKAFKDICNLGIKFFVIQITNIILFSSSNIFITQCLGPEHVRAYDVVYKIFSIVIIIHGLISAPLWNAYTDAYVKKDFIWLNKIVKKMVYLLLPIFFITVILIYQINFIVNLWIQEEIIIPKYLPECMGLYVFFNCWNNIWSVFVNGIGRINIQLFSNLISALVVLILSWQLMNLLGSSGMALAIGIGWICSGLPLCIQVRYILKNKI